jgi:copper chaperone CopZ
VGLRRERLFSRDRTRVCPPGHRAGKIEQVSTQQRILQELPMRFVVYLLAVLAAAGIVYFVGTSSNEPAQVADQAAPAAAEVADEKVASQPESETADPVESATQLVSLKVPDMHCPVACYPRVKSTLEGQAGVSGVDLAEQKEEGIIDNPVVLIQAGSDFDMDQAIAALADSGFENSEVVQN